MIQHGQPPMQGYNAQAAVTTGQIIVTAEVTTIAPDYGQLEPVVRAALRDLGQARVTDTPTTVLADAGYWHKDQMERIITDGLQVLIPPDSGLREGARPGWEGGFYAFMRRVLSTDHGRSLYGKRKSIEPVFGQIKCNRRIDRFKRRGRDCRLSSLPSMSRRISNEPGRRKQTPADRRHRNSRCPNRGGFRDWPRDRRTAASDAEPAHRGRRSEAALTERQR